VYTTRGTLLAAAFSGTCTVCGAVFSHSHFEPRPHGDDEKAEFFFDPTHSPYFQLTGQSVFEVRLLEQVTQQIVHAGATFESQASVYSSSFGEIDKARLLSYEQNFSRIIRHQQTSGS